MKKTGLIVLISWQLGWGQNFTPIGAKWKYYELSQNAPEFEQCKNYTEFEVIKNTIVLSKPTKKIIARYPIRHKHQKFYSVSINIAKKIQCYSFNSK